MYCSIFSKIRLTRGSDKMIVKTQNQTVVMIAISIP